MKNITDKKFMNNLKVYELEFFKKLIKNIDRNFFDKLDLSIENHSGIPLKGTIYIEEGLCTHDRAFFIDICFEDKEIILYNEYIQYLESQCGTINSIYIKKGKLVLTFHIDKIDNPDGEQNE